MVCVSITELIVAVSLSLIWINDTREPAIRWWCTALWVAVLATGIYALRPLIPHWFAVSSINFFLILAFALAAAGFAVFNGNRMPPAFIAAGPLAWVLGYLAIPGFIEHLAWRATALTVILGAYCLMIVRCSWQGWKQEGLPSFLATAVIYTIHVGFYVLRTVLAFLYPVAEDLSRAHSGWAVLSALEAFAMSIFSAFMFFALIKERAEYRYRLAAEIDGLTGAATRRFFVSQTRERLAKAPKNGALAVIDLDFFKSVNDCYGHLGGDRVLQAFGKFVDSRLEAGMIFGRLGGEEFGLYIGDREASEAKDFLERLRSDIEAMQIVFMGSPIRITISVGLASVREVGLDFDHLMAAADGALYMAKEEGRNRIKLFSLAMRMNTIVEMGNETRLGLAEQRLSRMMVRSKVGRS
jgi:diguanylate cyclase (GGDEF)-like protein